MARIGHERLETDLAEGLRIREDDLEVALVRTVVGSRVVENVGTGTSKLGPFGLE